MTHELKQCAGEFRYLGPNMILTLGTSEHSIAPLDSYCDELYPGLDIQSSFQGLSVDVILVVFCPPLVLCLKAFLLLKNPILRLKIRQPVPQDLVGRCLMIADCSQKQLLLMACLIWWLRDHSG